MAIHSMLQAIGIKEGADISAAGTHFVEHIREYIDKAQDNPSGDNAKREEAALLALYKSFFPYSVEWTKTERAKYLGKKNHPEAANLKERGDGVITDLQKNIINYALCSMHLHQAKGMIKAEMRKHPETPEEDKIKWTSDTGLLMQKYRGERKELIADNARLAQGKGILQRAEKEFIKLEKEAHQLFGKEAAEIFLRPYRNALRIADFETARKSLASLLKAKKKFSLDKKKGEKSLGEIKKAGESYVQYLQDGLEFVVNSEDRVLLKTTELNVVYDTQAKEIAQKEAFIRKYFRPYLGYILQSMRLLESKLLVLGSMESLMTLYIRLLRGLAEPLTDVKAVRLYESEVIENISYLLDGKFQEIYVIEQRNKESMDEFKISVEDFALMQEEVRKSA